MDKKTTYISTFSDFVRYVPADKIVSDWNISLGEIKTWMDNPDEVPTWIVPMLIHLYNMDDALIFVPLGSAIIV